MILVDANILVHAMSHGPAAICSYDQDLDVIEALRRIQPETPDI